MNSDYQISLTPAAKRDLDRITSEIFQRIVKSLKSLEQNPRPQGIKKLANRENEWRIRVGNHRILFEIDDDQKLVTIFRIRHRKDVYRNR